MTTKRTDEPRINLSDAARMVGFKDRRTFTHWMREAGVTPVQATYRKQQKLLTSGQVEQVRAYIAQQGGRLRAARTEDARSMEASSAQHDDIMATLTRLVENIQRDWQDLLTVLMAHPEAVAPLTHDRNAAAAGHAPPSPIARTRLMPVSAASDPLPWPSLASDTVYPLPQARPRLPAELRSWREYTRLHHLKESEVRHHVDLDEERGGFPTVFNEEGWAHKHYTVKVAFDARGQAAFHRKFRAHWGGGACPYCDDDHDYVDEAATRPDLDAVTPERPPEE